MSDIDLGAAREWLACNPTATSVNVNAYVAALNEIERLRDRDAEVLRAAFDAGRDYEANPHDDTMGAHDEAFGVFLCSVEDTEDVE